MVGAGGTCAPTKPTDDEQENEQTNRGTEENNGINRRIGTVSESTNQRGGKT